MFFQSNNDKLFYHIEGDGYPVLILHAMGTDHHAMKKWIEPIFAAKEGFQRIYVDLPWHGQSVCKGIKSSEEVRELLFTFIMKVVGTKQFSCIGHSFGGYIAQGLVCPQLSGLCLLAPAVHKKNRNVPEKAVYGREDISLAKVEPEVRTAFETLMVYQSSGNLQTFLEEVQPGRLLADIEFLTSSWRDSGYFFNKSPLAEQYTGTSLIIAGKLDSICGYKDYYELIECMPNSTFVLLQAGHLLHIEKRNSVQFLIREWVNSLEGSDDPNVTAC
ncbi:MULTISPECIES: alpha/beta hydrolase [unclassified Sutcliffiella]|uniref:alpha/beta fold hydrolase n=1 Tax=unclassified Sutcliffiella TaxID=2837532 RepID=UPI0030D27EAE